MAKNRTQSGLDESRAGGRTARREESPFVADPGLPTDRFESRFGAGAEGAAATEAWLAELLRQAERQEYSPVGQVVQIFLGVPPTRDIDWQKQGPMLALTAPPPDLRLAQTATPNAGVALPGPG